MKEGTKIALSCILSTILVLAILFGAVVLFFACDTENHRKYFKSVDFVCTAEEFEEEYYPLYYAEIQRLKEKYGLEYQEHIDKTKKHENSVEIDMYFYCEEYTVIIKMDGGGAYSTYTASLYYYGNGELTPDYEKCSDSVNFLNDFTNYVAYDAITEKNCFSELLEKAKSDEKKFASEYLHFDDFVGYVEYRVNLKPSKKTGGYYYMKEFNKELEKECYYFEFHGILKDIKQ